MKRTFLSLALLVCAVAPCRGHCGEAREAIRDRVAPLGKRFVQSLKDDNIVGYSQCWVAGPLLCDLIGSVERLTQEDLKEMKEYYLRRDREIGAFFGALRAELEKLAANRSQMSLESILAKGLREERNKHGETVRVLRQIIVTIRIDASTLVRVDVDDGAEIGGNWYFSDTPDSDIEVITIYKGKEKRSRTIRLDVKTPSGTTRRGGDLAPRPGD